MWPSCRQCFVSAPASTEYRESVPAGASMGRIAHVIKEFPCDILTALSGVTVGAITACAAATSFSFAPATTPAAPSLSAFVSASGPVLSHECPDCGGSDHCGHCIGTGASGNAIYSKQSCSSCKGTGTCQSCLEPGLVLVPAGKH